MNRNKICVVACNSDKDEINKSLDELNIPNNYIVEKRFISISNETNISKEYNKIIKTCDAKYKIYFQQGVSINNNDLLTSIIDIFLSDRNIGIIGAVGSETIPTSGVWQESINKCGKYYEAFNNKNKKIVEYKNDEYIKKVKVIDGMLMATQYDINWREDLFDYEYFYDIAQCVEFTKSGYEVVVPKQNEPWCTKKNVTILADKFSQSNEVFLQEYSKDIFPLVSILIPAYNRPDLLKIALESAVNQTYKNIEIIVCDDSTNDGVKDEIQPYLVKHNNIRYYNNGGPLGERGLLNAKKCLQLSKGEYINYLLDDDVFHIDKIKKMMNYYLEYDEISLVTSNRELIDENGRILPKEDYNECLFNEDKIINGIVLGEYIVRKNLANIVGELTTVLIRKIDIIDRFGMCFEYQCRALTDIGMWFDLMSKGKVVYLNNALSYFRIHNNRNTNNHYIAYSCIIDYFNIINVIFNRSLYIDNEIQYTKTMVRFVKNSLESLSSDKNDCVNKELKDSVYDCLKYSMKYIMKL